MIFEISVPKLVLITLHISSKKKFLKFVVQCYLCCPNYRTLAHHPPNDNYVPSLFTILQVEELKLQLASQDEELQQKTAAADKLISIVAMETEKMMREKAAADEEENRVASFAADVTHKQRECEQDLEKAEPALVAAQEALNTLNKGNLTELKTFGKPPRAVANVASAVMVLMAHNGHVPRDRSWKAAKVMMAKTDSFLDSLVHFDKENIHESCLKALQPYLQDPDFDPKLIQSKSLAAAGLCSWVVNIVRFHQVHCEVEPKRQTLNKANAELAYALNKLDKVKARVLVGTFGCAVREIHVLTYLII
uniref:Dynein heavy chain coiled coil stalk domain-containing protein n=1 Tax=Eptatretus burgeri TaxID=7764 RepID=A0A8C4QW83_EPTBU